MKGFTMHFSSKNIILLFTFLLISLSCAFADRVKWVSQFQNTDITGGIIVDANYIYLSSLDSLSQLQLVDGKSRWSVQIKDSTLLRPIKSGGGVLALSKEGKVYLVSDSTHTVVKTVDLNAEVLNDPLVISTNIYIPTSKGVIAFSTQTNNIVWQTKSECSVHNTPLAIGDKIMYACENGNVELVSRSTGEIVDRAKYDYVFWKSSPTLLDNNVYIGTFDGKIVSLSRSNPKMVRWVVETPDGTPVYADLVTDGANVIMTTTGGKLCALKDSGEYSWCINTASGVGATPIVTDGGIYAITDNGVLYSISHDGNINWVYDSSMPTKMDMVKKGSMIYVASKNGTVAGVSLSSCNILFPVDNSDVSGVDLLEVEVDAYSDTPISKVQVKAADSEWIDATNESNRYLGKIPSNQMPLGKFEIMCRVVSEEGEEFPPYSKIEVIRKASGKKMSVEVPSSVGYGSSFEVRIKDENGAPLDRASVVFGNLRYNNVSGSIRITPSAKGTYKLEVRRPGYVPFKGEVTVGDDYTIIVVMIALALTLVAVFYIFYRRWMEE